MSIPTTISAWISERMSYPSALSADWPFQITLHSDSIEVTIPSFYEDEDMPVLVIQVFNGELIASLFGKVGEKTSLDSLIHPLPKISRGEEDE